MTKKENRTYRYQLANGKTAISMVVSNYDYLCALYYIENGCRPCLDFSRADWEKLDTCERKIFRLKKQQLKRFERYFKYRCNEKASDICGRYKAKTVKSKKWYER